MSTDKVLIVLGEPNSTFSEILIKYFKSSNYQRLKKKNYFNWKLQFA